MTFLIPYGKVLSEFFFRAGIVNKVRIKRSTMALVEDGCEFF